MSPYHRYNLRRNPFGELLREERSRLAIVDARPWLDLLSDRRSVLQFIGPCGHGKTTHLLAIESLLPSCQYVYLPEFGPLPHVSNQRPMIIDESQRLSFWQWRRVLRIGGPLVLGTHRDDSAFIRRAGYNVTTIDVSENHSSDKLAAILNRRIEASRLTELEVPQISKDYATRLQSKFGANVRAIEHFLYDQFQRCALEQIEWPHAN